MYCEDVSAMCQGEKKVYHYRSAGLLLPLSLSVVDKDRGRWSEKIAREGSHRKHHPRERKFMEKEQLKVCTKTLGLNFQNILCV